MRRAIANPVVHLELRTANLARACAFYARLFGWRMEAVHAGSAAYQAIELGTTVQGGVVELEVARPLWLPYVEVADIAVTTERARALGADVLFEPREGPAGWRCALAAPACGEIALWQPKA